MLIIVKAPGSMGIYDSIVVQSQLALFTYYV